MSEFDWRNLLTQWSAKILQSGMFDQELPPDVIASGWLGYPGATAAQIAQAEARLGQQLPPSYRAFLLVSNGWRITGSFIDRLWSTEEIEWFRVRHQHDWIDAWITGARSQGPLIPISDRDYFVYGSAQSVLNIRLEYLQTALEVSEVGDSAIYLLNPQVVTAAGEWEAWFFASWLPGANRYRSFWEMMQKEYEQFR